MFNKTLKCTSNRADPPRPWTEALTSRVLERAGRSKYSPMNQARPWTGALTSRVLADQTGWPVKMFSHEFDKDVED